MASSWERLGSTTLGSAGDQIDVTIAARKYLIIKVHAEGDGAAKLRMRFNDDSGSNYSYRASPNGGSDGNSSSGGTEMDIDNVNLDDGEQAMNELYVINVADKEKICINNHINNGGVGAGNAPDRVEQTTKWVNTSAQIVKVSLINPMGGDYAVGSTVTVWGTDDQGTTAKDKSTITNVPVGTRYEETDTRKIFRRAAGDENVGTSGTDSNWAEVVFDNSTIANNAQATGNAVSRSSGSGWDSYIRSSVNKLSPATGGGEVYFTQSASGNSSFGLEKAPFNSAPSAVYTSRDYSFHTTSSTNNMYEGSNDFQGTAYTGSTNEFRITMDSDGEVNYYWRSGNSGSWTNERVPSNVTASGDYYVSVSPDSTGKTIYCYIKSSANPSWKEKGTA